MVTALHSDCQRPSFNPWSGNRSHKPCGTDGKKKKKGTVPTKVRLVKATVFPVVMYGCGSWTVKKAEHRRIDAFEL